jgi:hypothetical protein
LGVPKLKDTTSDEDLYQRDEWRSVAKKKKTGLDSKSRFIYAVSVVPYLVSSSTVHEVQVEASSRGGKYSGMSSLDKRWYAFPQF